MMRPGTRVRGAFLPALFEINGSGAKLRVI